MVKARRDKKQSVVPALVGLVPFVGMSVVAYSWLNASPYIVTEHLVPWILYIGLSFGYTVGLMITAHVTHQPFPLFNISFLPLVFGAVNANLPVLGVYVMNSARNVLCHRSTSYQLTKKNTSLLPCLFFSSDSDRIFGHHQENIYLWSCLAFSAAAYAHFAVNVVNDICDYFDIWCFTIKHPKKSE